MSTTEILLWASGWLVLTLAAMVVARFVFRDPPLPRTTQTILSEQERKDIFVFHAIKSPTLSEPARKGFAKNYQRFQ